MIIKKETVKKYKEKGKKVKRDKLEDEKKLFRKTGQQKKKGKKRDNLGNDEKEQLRKYVKKGKRVMCNNLEAGEKEKVRKNGKKRKMDKHLIILAVRSSIFDNVQILQHTYNTRFQIN